MDLTVALFNGLLAAAIFFVLTVGYAILKEVIRNGQY